MIDIDIHPSPVSIPGAHAVPTRLPLDAMFHPKVVAVVGATETPGTVGLTLMRNLCIEGNGITVYPVHPTRNEVLSRKAWPDITRIPEPVDLAVIATPAATVPSIIRQCVDMGVPAAVIVSAGFRECGATGAALEKEILAEVHRAAGSMRIVGPNCLGLANPTNGMNATFAHGAARKGGVAFLSQSGALCTAVLDWSVKQNVGFSAFVSIGSMLDVDWGDLIDYFGDDPNTKAIAIYMESVGDARSFLSAAREVSLSKPIVVVKAGRTAAAAKAAASHTGSLTGSDEVIDAAMQRVGVLRVDSIAELFDMVEALGMQRPPEGPRLTIITNAGGPGVLAADALITAGGQFAELTPETMDALNRELPAAWSHSNPIDILGDAGPDRYVQAARAAARDLNTDGLLAILTPQSMTDPTATAERLKDIAQTTSKPVFASWMGGEEVEAGREILSAANIPTFDFPDQAAQIFQNMWRYRSNLRSLYETVTLPSTFETSAARIQADSIVAEIRRSNRTILSEHASKQLLQAYGINCVPTMIALNEEEAIGAAGKIGFPVVLKLHSETITHKAAAGGVRLNLSTPAAVRVAFHEIEEAVTAKAGRGHFLGVTVQPMILRRGYELILGSSVDPQFGPVLLFGTGGSLVEVFKDRALALPPLNPALAHRMIEQTQIFNALKRDKSVDLTALKQLIVRFSQLVVERRDIREIDINPLLLNGEQLLALDARIVLHEPNIPQSQLPQPAIRPYPTQYVWSWKSADDAAFIVRPILPEDETLIAEFHKDLSDQTLHFRYGGIMKLEGRVAHERLLRGCFTDYDRHIALVADHETGKGKHEIAAVGRLIKSHGTNEAEFSLVVADSWQNRGLGGKMLELLIQVARSEKLNRIVGQVFNDNRPMLGVCEKAGFKLIPGAETRVEMIFSED